MRFAVIAYGFVVLMLALSLRPIGGYGVETDFYWCYAPQAQALQHGQIVLDNFRGPLYPAILALFGFVFGDLFRCGQLISALSAVAVLAFVVKFSAEFDRRVAWIAVALTAANRTFFEYAYTAGTDMLFAALVVWCAYALWRERLLTAMLLAAAASLMRYNGMVLLPVVLFYVWRRREWRPLLGLLPVTVWGVYTWIVAGKPFPNENMANIAFANTGGNWDQFWYNGGADVSPWTIAVNTAKNLAVYLWYDLSRLMFLPVGLLAVWMAVRDKRREALLVLASLFAVNALPFWSDRFALALVPYLSAMAARWAE